ncbi:MAG TPA: alpha/beta hydrolase [Verrucomicrobia bacterium]|nr:alpha/beta hydrolase [Verrucomicrobiales bacterium]HIL55968.1 alpha/beta hydrolase [Verrucomicrobiota bacterium]
MPIVKIHSVFFGLFVLGTVHGSPIQSLEEWLSADRGSRKPMPDSEFSKLSLSEEDAVRAKELLWKDHAAMIRETRSEEMKSKSISLGGKTMKFDFIVFGEKPKNGRSLFISMHGGGGAPPKVNEGQWRNQMRLYKPKEGIYLCPRAPTDTWNLWHQSHIDPLFDRLIENLTIFEEVNPERVYLMGYSAGGDGVYQLAPRMCDRFAAAAMMAGHPNESTPLGLRNLPFALQVGANDGSYGRNKVAASWGAKLADLRSNDLKGYDHFVKIHEGKGHWMNLEDKVAVPWMAKRTRNRLPKKIVWKQDDVTHGRSYWVALPGAEVKARQLIVVSREGQQFNVDKADGIGTLCILLNDEMIDFAEPVTVKFGGKKVHEGKVSRSIAAISRTMIDRGDPGLIFSAILNVKLK